MRHAAAVLWTGGTAYRLTDPVSHRSARLDVASQGGRTRLQLTTGSLVIWLGGIETSATPTFVCIQSPPAAPSCNPPKATRTTAQAGDPRGDAAPDRVLEGDRAEDALGRARAGDERGRVPGGLPAGHGRRPGFGAVRLCTTRDGLLTEVSYKGVKVQALSVKPEITAADLARPG